MPQSRSRGAGPGSALALSGLVADRHRHESADRAGERRHVKIRPAPIS